MCYTLTQRIFLFAVILTVTVPKLNGVDTRAAKHGRVHGPSANKQIAIKSEEARNDIILTKRANEEPSSPFKDKKPSPVNISEFTYLGWAAYRYWWISNNKLYKKPAFTECQLLLNGYKKLIEDPKKVNLSWNLADPDEEQYPVIEYVLTERNLNYVWVRGLNIVDILPTGNRKKRKHEGSYNHNKHNARFAFIKPTENGNSKVGMSSNIHRIETHSKMVSYSKAGLNKITKREAVVSGGFQVTVQETHFPWLEEWKNRKGCNDFLGCKPVNCTVTTKPCTISNGNCVFDNTTTCSILDTGTCNAICENCKIDRDPECWMAENKCEVVQQRTCKLAEPECRVEALPCTISRPPCVTKQGPCKTKVTEPAVPEDCKQPQVCGTSQSMSCEKVNRTCTDEESKSGKKACQTITCKALPICILPEYCRKVGPMSQLDCEPPTTFCPPEIVKCPPPKVNCGEPKLECTDPVINCPPPKALCSAPRVTCSPPKLSCPTVVSQCANPTAICSPPVVTCEDPVLKCTEPQPCFVSDSMRKSCSTNQPNEPDGPNGTNEPDGPNKPDECDKIRDPGHKKCKCVATKRTSKGIEYETYRPCDDKYHYFCIAQEADE